MNKRERVFKALQLEEPDKCPIHYLGFERTSTAYQYLINSREIEPYVQFLDGVGDITEQRFLNVDTWVMDCIGSKYVPPILPSPPEYPECKLTLVGKLSRTGKNEATGMPYGWYVGGYFKTESIIREYWAVYGKPSSHLNKNLSISRTKWQNYVDALSPYLYPMVSLGLAVHEALFEGMTAGRLAYFMRKNPSFVHEVVADYMKVNIEIVKFLAENGIEIVFYYDDLGQRDRSILSLKNFREFILPYYKELYQTCKKRGVFIIQHSCGFIDDFLPDMADAGLNGIQALEPAAGVNLLSLKQKLDDKIAFFGGMDSTRVLNFGTPQDVYDDVKKCIQAAGHGGGYFAGPSHNILNVPWENLQALRAAIEKYRGYPII
jgi:hypothetical protein